MQGSFTIGLLEVLGYLLPGGLVLACFLSQRAPDLGNKAASVVAGQILFVAASYLLGHLLTLLSLSLAKLRAPLKWLLRVRPREERLQFYPKLRSNLRERFGYQLTKDDEYYFSLRLVSEFQPHSSQTIDRLYALTLFARNMVAALLVVAFLVLPSSLKIALIMFGFALIFFVRYYHLERATADTLLRAAYVYFCSEEEVENRRKEAKRA
jgi:hypothetical protein